MDINPVRAKMVKHPGEYAWSSYAANATGKSDALLTPHPLYNALGVNRAERLFAYRELFQPQLDSEQVHTIREALNEELVLGREDFKDKISRMTSRQTRRGVSGRPRIEEEEAIYYVF